MAGGVALNCVANGKILKEGLFKNIWIQPASGDAGGALGAAQAFYYQELDNKRRILKPDAMNGSYLGPQFTDDQVEDELKSVGANYKKLTLDQVIKDTAKALSEEKVVGWFQGRMEFGPRSLGNRSIIADPRSEKMQKNLNLILKCKEDKTVLYNLNQMIKNINYTKKLIKDIDSNRVTIVPYLSNVQETWNEVSSCNLMISTRLHASIFACYAQVPFFLIEYHKKCSDFLSDVGQDVNYRLYDAEITPKEVLLKINEIFNGSSMSASAKLSNFFCIALLAYNN